MTRPGGLPHCTALACISPRLVQATPSVETCTCQYTRFGAMAGTVILQPDVHAVPLEVSLSKLYGEPFVLQASGRPLQ